MPLPVVTVIFALVPTLALLLTVTLPFLTVTVFLLLFQVRLLVAPEGDSTAFSVSDLPRFSESDWPFFRVLEPFFSLTLLTAFSLPGSKSLVDTFSTLAG